MMKKKILIKLVIIVLINLISISQVVRAQTLSGRVYEGTTGIEPPASKPMVGVTVTLYGSNDANMIGTFVISTTTTDANGWYGLPVRGAFDFYNINPAGYIFDGATSVSGTVKAADWIQYTYDELSQTTTGNKFWIKKETPANSPPVADADGPYTGSVNQPVQFDGSGSYDPDTGDSITSYEWDLDSDGQYDDATGVYPTWTWSSSTTHSIHLKVTDTHGATGTDSSYVRIEAPVEYDYGDAPDPSYPTLKASNGARHQIDPDVFLGSKIDADQDGQQNPDATGDDNDGNDDEDGIVFKSAFIPGNGTPFEATVSRNGYLGVWVDLNGNGSWADPGESLFQSDTMVHKGVNTWSIYVPAYAKVGKTFARFRFSTIPGQTFNGSWQDGEVEDYQVEIMGGGEGASVGDWVWNDLNQNGLQDAGEQGLDSVQVSLYDQNGNMLASTQTTSTGFYMFSNITPGSYFINFGLRPGFAYSPPDQGMDDTIDSDAQYGTGNTQLFTLAAGEHNTNMDAGMYRGEGPDELDFGDAPDPNYPTLLASNGARHVIRPGFFLGSAIDPEPNGFPTPLGDGDNTNNINDEDGVTMSPFIAPGQSVPITVIASDSGVLNAWIDFNRDGDWADAGEHFIPAMPVYSGANSFTMNVPGNARFGLTYARFRLSSIRQLSYDGLAPNGEVEDYAVQIVEGDDGSITIIKDANPKDNTPFLICTHFTSGFFNILCVNLRDPLMDKWTILNPYQVISVTETSVPGWKLTDITVTGDLDNGSTINVTTGSVDVDYDPGENIVITFKNEKTGGDEYDFGDAPDPNYPTLLANNGARHIIKPNFYLGSVIDAEPDGMPSANADGDNLTSLNDEDGVTMFPFIVPGQATPVTVVASDSGVLNAWLDFNINGSWADAGEHFIAAQPVLPGANSFTLNVPSNAVIGKSYARFRLSSVRNVSYDGVAPDGEVEDYAVNIIEGGGGGSLTIIKDAMPKDNTPFWITTIYGAMGGAAAFRDPLSNSATISNGPAGTYHLGESVPAGWKLMDIIITGDVDNGSVVNPGIAGADIDLDAGENITVTFKNEKTSGKQFDFGDAPDGTNHHGVAMEAYAGIPARFPTVFDPATGLPSGPIHRNPLGDAWLGNSFSLEEDADIMPDDDGLTNIDPPNNIADRDGRDDGVIFPIVLPSGQNTYFTYSLTIPPGSAGSNRYVNVWLDWNRDGDWEDILTFQNPNDAPEWAVQNQLIPAGIPPGAYVFATPLFLTYHPGNTETKPIWMRISIAEQPAPQPADGRGPAAGYEFGETEDYYFFANDTTTGKLYDFGDAPDDPQIPGYPTLHANGGAYHTVVAGFHLGALIDSEPNGQPDPVARGDDNTGIADEDGLVANPPLIRGTTATWEIAVAATGIFNAWIDFNGNHNWLDANEHIFKDVPINVGNTTLNFTVPSTAVIGHSYARLRLSNVIGVKSTGYGRDGEVEDYQVEINPGGVTPRKWFQRSLVNEDADMPFTPYFIGWDEPSLLHEIVIADDWFCKDPRPVTHIRWRGSYTNWDSAAPPANAPYAFHIGVWSDVQATDEMPWSHPGILIWEWELSREMLNECVVGNDFFPDRMEKPDTCFQYDFFIPKNEWFYQEGDSTIYWLSIAAIYEQIPEQHAWGWLTRQHYFHDDAVRITAPKAFGIGSPVEWAEPIGEMWDMVFVLSTDEYRLEFDFGDAPAERYQTFLGQNGAHHFVDPGIHLGERIDVDPDGQPDELALGDDLDGSDDDDGVQLKTTLQPGQQALFEVMASTDGFLNAWIDFNNNGDWADPQEQLFFDAPLIAGSNHLEILVPAEAVSGKAYARFRFSKEPHLPFFGLAINGEVEDYLFDIHPVGVEQSETSIIPKEFRLYPKYPNPFNPATIIRFDLPAKSNSSYHVNLSIYNIRGQLIRKLVDEDKSPGAFTVKWDGRNNFGQKVNSGIYLVKIVANYFRAYQKMIILK